MKNIKLFSLISLFAFVFNSCSSLEEPVDPALLRVVITTKAMSNVDMNTASSGGEILQDGNSEITERGVVWGLTANPTVINSKSISGSGLGSYNSNLTGLSANRSYFLRAYAINSSGVHYGNQVVFTTTAVSNLAVLTTTAISNNNTGISAISGGNITSQGGSAVIARGVVWSTNPFPTTTDFKTTNGSGTGAFVSTLNGLSLATTYYVRAYATNSMITAYGNQFTFVTPAVAPVTDYWPMALNNEWTNKVNGTTQAPNKIVSIDVIGANSYYSFNPVVTAGVSGTTRVRKASGEYFRKIEDVVVPGISPLPSSTTTGYEELCLKDNIAVAGTWTQSYIQTTSYNPPILPSVITNFSTVFTIEEKGTSIILNGTTYTDIIKVKEEVTSTPTGGTPTTYTNYYWYAKGVGPIKYIKNNGTTITSEIVSYILN